MSKQIEAMKRWVEVFDGNWHDEPVDSEWADRAHQSLTEMRQAIAEAEQPAQQEPVLWQILNGVCHAGVRSTENLAKEAAAGMQKTHDLGGSLAAFHVRPLYTTPQAQQVPLTDIYRSFEQWKNGNVLEHGVPRTEYYSEQELSLVEMGWKYGYDAILAEQPAPTEADLMRCWVEKPNGEIDGIASMKKVLEKFGSAQQPAREPLTDEQIAHATAPVFMGGSPSLTAIARAIEAAHGITKENT